MTHADTLPSRFIERQMKLQWPDAINELIQCFGLMPEDDLEAAVVAIRVCYSVGHVTASERACPLVQAMVKRYRGEL